MPSAAYFRRQADICLRLSAIASDQDLVVRLLAMADDYKAKAGAAEPGDGPGDGEAEFVPAHMTGSPDQSDADRDRE